MCWCNRKKLKKQQQLIPEKIVRIKLNKPKNNLHVHVNMCCTMYVLVNKKIQLKCCIVHVVCPVCVNLSKSIKATNWNKNTVSFVLSFNRFTSLVQRLYFAHLNKNMQQKDTHKYFIHSKCCRSKFVYIVYNQLHYCPTHNINWVDD